MYTKTKFDTKGCVADVIICFKFYRNRLRGFRAAGAKNGGLSFTLSVALTTVLPVMESSYPNHNGKIFWT